MHSTNAASQSPRRVLLICHAAIGRRLSGPGVRYWEFARALSAQANLQVTLATVPGIAAEAAESGLSFRLLTARDEADLRSLAAQADVVVAVGSVFSLYPSLARINTPRVVDLYIPLLLEELQRSRPQPLAEQSLFFDRQRRDLTTQILAAGSIGSGVSLPRGR